MLCSQFPVYTISLSCSPGVTSDMMSCLLSASSPLHQPIRGQVCRLLANQRPRMGCHSRCLFMLQPSLLNIQPLGSEKNVKCYFLSYEYNTRQGSIRSNLRYDIRPSFRGWVSQDWGLWLDKNGPNRTFFCWPKQIFPSILYDVSVS